MGYNFDDQEPRTQWWIIITVAIVITVVVGGYFAWRGSRQAVPTKETAEPTKLPRMANLPPKEEAPKPVPPPYSTDAPLLEQVREAMRKGIDPEDAVSLAKSLPQKPERADAAFILLEYAAETGNGEAAKYVARYYDPTDDFPSGTIRKNPEIAYDWYQKALAGGHEDVQQNMAKLRIWVEEQASQGSNEACQLLKDWR